MGRVKIGDMMMGAKLEMGLGPFECVGYRTGPSVGGRYPKKKTV